MKVAHACEPASACLSLQAMRLSYFKNSVQRVRASMMHLRACGRANSRPHTPTKRQNVERECPKSDMKPKLKT